MPDNAEQYASPMPKQLADQVAAAEAMIAGTYGQQPPQEGRPQPTNPEPVQPDLPMQMPPQQAPTHPEYDDEQTWERKFKSLQGRIEADQRNRQAETARLNQLENLLASLQAQGKSAKPAAPAELKAEKLITDAEAEEYGNDLLDVMGRRTKEVITPELQAINLKLSMLQDRVDGATKVITKQQQGTLYQSLAQAVPEWRAINHSAEFKNWLQNQDPYSGKKRHDMLMDAFTRQDTRLVVNFFQGFLTEAASLAPHSASPGTVTTPLPGNGQGNGQPSLADYAAPGRARSGPAPTPTDKPVWTTASISKFMADKLAGKFRGREADADALEADIFQAQKEGRIIV